MKSIETSLPWNGARVRVICGLDAFFESKLGRDSIIYLPARIALFYDPEVTESAVQDFLNAAAKYLASELERRARRSKSLCDACGISADGLKDLLTLRRDAQPWALYYSAYGGLGQLRPDDDRESRGVVPCSSMRNHGVAWENYRGKPRIWLATARKPGQDWDWDSDLGHESAHAAFAPVPLFVQPGLDLSMPLSNVITAKQLEPGHIARICYLFSEIAVVAVRGETRPTETLLPIEEREELFVLLRLCHQLIPGVGFDRALRAAQSVSGVVNPDGLELFEISAPILKVLPKLTRFTGADAPPDWEQFHRAIAPS